MYAFFHANFFYIKLENSFLANIGVKNVGKKTEKWLITN